LYAVWEPASDVHYTRVYAQADSGRVFAARLSDAIPALAGTRPFPALSRCFARHDAEDARACRSLLLCAAAAYNKNAGVGRKIVGFRLERWSWDLKRFPTDPGRAVLIGETEVAVTDR
jgi:hypothetical protein